YDIGREAFLEKALAWKQYAGDTIRSQIGRLGCSADWSRESFTMDPRLTKAVMRVFVELYKKGLAYRGTRLVNWDPALRTAISDLEVEQREVEGNLWYIRYPREDDPSKFITVATTRPETMFGDVAVAVNPKDDRYKGLAGRHVILPLANRRIPIVF